MTRLYIQDSLSNGKILQLSEQQAHYLVHVLRLKVGEEIHLFNEQDGQWQGQIKEIRKSLCQVVVDTQSRKPQEETPLWLLFAPLKHEALTFLVEKATELGVTHLQPIMTQYCNISRLNVDRLRYNAIGAAEQCERLSVPKVMPMRSFFQIFDIWDQSIPLFACHERGEGIAVQHAFKQSKSPAAFLIGPEGGLSETEWTHLKTKPFVQLVNLGPRILRAETAALAVLSCYQAIAGDWQG